MTDPDFYRPSAEELAKLTSYRPEGFDTSRYQQETEEVVARRIFREALPMAAKQIVDIAKDCINDRTRLTAAQYIVERNLGKVGDDPSQNSDLLRDLVEDMTSAFERGDLH